MTWVPAARRWAKSYGGRSYSVSCRQLGAPPTKEGSWRAANEWWAAKRAGLDARPEARRPEPGSPEARRKLLEAWAGRPLADEADAGLVLLDLTDHFRDKPMPAVVSEAFLGVERARELRAGTADLLDGAARVPPDRTVGGQAAAWLEARRAAVAAGEIDPGRYDSYRATLNLFTGWLGPGRPVESVTAANLEQFHTHLLAGVGERRGWERSRPPGKRRRGPGLSPAYAQTVLGTVKMFVARLAEHGLIPLPGNLRRLRITAGRPAVETVPVDEFRRLLGGCVGAAERTGLYLLLMANCGMYQGDLSDLGADEVDLAAGTVTRPRSKTPGGPVVRYKLWPETLALLRRHRNADPAARNDRGQTRVLVTARGGPLVPVSLDGGRLRKTDTVRSAYRRLTARLGVETPKPLKLVRKTSASLLAGHPQFKYFVPYFLGHSPRSTADRHYVKPADGEFFEALDWLRSEYGLPARGTG